MLFSLLDTVSLDRLINNIVRGGQYEIGKVSGTVCKGIFSDLGELLMFVP